MTETFQARTSQSPAKIALIDRPVFWYVLMLVMLLFTQLGGIEQEVIDWDESTFILMGADVAAGNLPYVEMYDVKPPMMFIFLGSIIALFGKSLLAIRLFGDLCILAAALACFALARHRTDVRSAGLATLLLVAMASNEFAQHTSTELPAVALLMWSLVLAILRPGSLWAAAGSGLLVSLAILTRSNLAPMAIMLGVLYLVEGMVRTSQTPRLAVVVFAAAGLLPPAVIVAIYGWAGQLDLLILSVIDVPLAYATGQLSMVGTLQSHISQYVVATTIAPAIFIPFTLAVIGGLAASVVSIKSQPGETQLKRFDLLLGAMLLAVTLSMLSGGAAYAHYWMQLIPLLAVFAAIGLHLLGSRSAAGAWVSGGATLVAVGAAILMTGESGVRVATDPASVRQQHHIWNASEQIRAQTQGRTPAIWAVHNHLIHWYLDAPLPSPIATHPDNIIRMPIIQTMAAAGYVPPNETMRIWQSKPEFVVVDANRSIAYLTENGFDLPQYLSANYRLVVQEGSVMVYRRQPQTGG